MDIKYELQEAIAKIVNRLQGQSLRPEEIHMEHPGNPSYGDYTSNIAISMFSNSKNIPKTVNVINNRTMKQWNNPNEIAEQIKYELEKDKPDFVDKINIVNAFVNISINTHWLSSQIERVITEKEKYGRSADNKKKIMVEFAHPNTHKLFHIGHLRNIITGESIARILQAAGYRVVRANYQGDVGMHIAKCLHSILKITNYKLQITKPIKEKIEFLGKCYVAGNKAYENDEKAKQEIVTINKKIYDKSDNDINELWSQTRKWSLEYFDQIYKRVYTGFDRLYFESEVYEKGREIALASLNRGILQKSEGAVIFPGSKYARLPDGQGLHDRVFLNSDCNPTYEAKDLGLAQLQFKEHNPDKIIHVVSKEQSGYFRVLFKALELILPETKDREFHQEYGWVRLKSGKMSSREGNVVLGEWLLDEAKERVGKIMDKVVRGGQVKDRSKTAEIIGVSAVKYSFLRQGVKKDLSFDIEESVSFEGNSGPYLLYTYARCRSVAGKANFKFSIFNFHSIFKQQFSINPEELAILRTIYKYPEAVVLAAEKLDPSLLCAFLYDLACKFNTFYNKHSILSPDNDNDGSKTKFRLLLALSVSEVIKNGLNLLGIKTAEKM